jgi:hypothetical protein
MPSRTYAFSGIDHGLVATLRNSIDKRYTEVECKLTYSVENPLDGFPHSFEIFVGNGLAARLLLNAAFRNGIDSIVPVELERCLHAAYEDKPAALKPSDEIVNVSLYKATEETSSSPLFVEQPAAILTNSVNNQKEIRDQDVLLELQSNSRVIDAWHVIMIDFSPDGSCKTVFLQSLSRDDCKKQIVQSGTDDQWKSVGEHNKQNYEDLPVFYTVPGLRVHLPELKKFSTPVPIAIEPVPAAPVAPTRENNVKEVQKEHGKTLDKTSEKQKSRGGDDNVQKKKQRHSSDEDEGGDPRPAKKKKQRHSSDEDEGGDPRPAKKKKQRDSSDEDDGGELRPAKKKKQRDSSDEDDGGELRPAKKNKVPVKKVRLASDDGASSEDERPSKQKSSKKEKVIRGGTSGSDESDDDSRRRPQPPPSKPKTSKKGKDRREMTSSEDDDDVRSRHETKLASKQKPSNPATSKKGKDRRDIPTSSDEEDDRSRKERRVSESSKKKKNVAHKISKKKEATGESSDDN